MKKKLLSLSILAHMAFALSFANDRVVSTSNVITELIVALGKEKTLIAVDTTSQFSDTLRKLPDIGYRMMLSTEGILSLKPSLIILTDDSGPENVLVQLKKFKVPTETVILPFDEPSLKAFTKNISCLLEACVEGEAINAKIAQDFESLNLKKEALASTTKAMFMMEETSGIDGRSFAGKDSVADKLITILGVTNVFKEDFSNYKKVNLETQLLKNPDIVLLGKRADYGKMHDLYRIVPASVLNWPQNIAPKCVIEVDISRYLLFGIHIYERALKLHEAMATCMVTKEN